MKMQQLHGLKNTNVQERSSIDGIHWKKEKPKLYAFVIRPFSSAEALRSMLSMVLRSSSMRDRPRSASGAEPLPDNPFVL